MGIIFEKENEREDEMTKKKFKPQVWYHPRTNTLAVFITMTCEIFGPVFNWVYIGKL